MFKLSTQVLSQNVFFSFLFFFFSGSFFWFFGAFHWFLGVPGMDVQFSSSRFWPPGALAPELGRLSVPLGLPGLRGVPSAGRRELDRMSASRSKSSRGRITRF